MTRACWLLLLLTLAINTAWACTDTPTGVDCVISYTEMTKNITGGPVGLVKTTLYWKLGNGAEVKVDTPATSPEGGGVISKLVTFPIGPGQSGTVTLTWTATNSFGEGPRSPSTTWYRDRRSEIRSAAPTTAAQACPASGCVVIVPPGTDLASLVASGPPGTTFWLQAGVHRTSAQPKSDQTFTGDPGAILSGATLLTTWTKVGAVWTAEVTSQAGVGGGSCADGSSVLCKLPEDLFADDERVRRVAKASVVGEGTFSFDGAKVTYGSDPTGKRMELSVRPYALRSSAANVTIRGLIVEKVACAAQRGAIQAWDASEAVQGTGWLIEGAEIRWNHGTGIRLGTGMTVRGGRVHHNGQLGIGGKAGAGIVIDGVEIDGNNTAGYDWGWEGGCCKFAATTGLIVRNNHVHHNEGPGLWTDIDNIDTLYEGNLVEDNAGPGVYHEISYAAVIRNNVIRRNGAGFSGWAWGAGIQIAASGNVEVFGNTLSGNVHGIILTQQARGTGSHGPRLVQNVFVHDNTIEQSGGRASGIVQDTGDQAVFTQRNNRFATNHYLLTNGATHVWNTARVTPARWRALGQDVDGTWD